MKTNCGKAFVIFLPIVFYLQAFCQEGNPVLKNYFHTSEETDHLNICIRQSFTGDMLLANSKGLLSYDGQNWKLTATENTPIIIETHKASGKIFAGFYKDFGYFFRDETGVFRYYSTSPGKNVVSGEITRIVSDNTHAYYFNEKAIYKVDIASDEVESSWKSPPGKVFTGIFLFKNNLFINIEGKGLHRVNGKSFIPLPCSEIFSQSEILFALPLKDTSVLIGSTLDELHIFNGHTSDKFQLEAEVYLKSNFLTDGIDIGNNQIALSTLAGGFIIAHKITGKTIYMVNSSSGLPDNEIYAIGCDLHGGVWVSHHYGVSRLDPHLPFREYSNYPGLSGNLLSALHFKNTLYVATSDGVFYLTKKTETPVVSHAAPQEKDYYEKKQEKKILHHFLDQVFHKRKFKKTEKPAPETTVQKSTPVPFTPDLQTNPEYYFQKINGISAKCRQLILVNDYILVSSNKGLFEIRDHQAKEIIREEYINYIFPGSDNSFFIGLRHGLICLKNNNGKWFAEKILRDHIHVHSITRDYAGQLWIGSSGKILKLILDSGNKILHKEEFHLPEFHNELIYARSVHGIPTFFLSDGVYYYNSREKKILKDPALNFSVSSYRFNASQDNITWYRSEEGWIGLNHKNEQEDIRVPYLNFFKNIRSVHLDNSHSLWVLNGNNQLFRLNLKEEIFSKIFNLHIQQIKNPVGKVLPITDLNLSHSENSLHFFLSAPFFPNEESVQYQYFIEGLMNGWSEWSKDSKIELTYLPVGNHVLHARARNGLGQFSDLEKVSISILPPYWKSGWFFILEVVFFFSLIVASVILNRSSHSRFFTKAITFLTLILVVEFIVYQLESFITVGNSENPLIRFSFNVMLALMISPVEKFLEIAISKRRRKIAKLMLMWRRYF